MMDFTGVERAKYNGLRLSADDYLSLPDDGVKYQVIDGVVVGMPSTTLQHQIVLVELAAQFAEFLKQSQLARAFPDIDVRFAADLVYRPDLVVVRSERLPKPLKRIDVVLDLIVEILSPSSEAMDERTKLADYERLGVKEYWIVSPIDPVTVRPFRLRHGRLVQARDATFDSVVLPGFRLDIELVRRDVRD